MQLRSGTVHPVGSTVLCSPFAGMAVDSKSRKRDKKADVMEHPEAFDHTGLLAEQSYRSGQAVLHLVVRRIQVNLL